ncbi:MmgE/PrpD family protein [Fodinisporobacter ferrooxydans]|uniref:MmgE/PrpD family protein n=1 Tax=Fodinisporobacter ferrooxydans TaxID=2901836 RepID=A0ABY4CKV7_9BACL|nr:MmgE/PrpD family protein [Alicyclobacillaceae bacterium MYW30-H2]
MSRIDLDLTKILAEHVDMFHRIQLPSPVIHQVKRVLLDYLCAAVTGSQTEVSRLLYAYLLETEGEGEFRTIGFEKGLSKTNSAFLNGTNAHCLDFDDGHTQGSIHPGAVVIPAVLAAARHVKATPQQWIAAVVAGYDICLRISSAMHPASRNRGFHNTPVAGIFGAAAAASFLNGATVAQIQQAFGIAGSFCGGIFAFLGSGSEVKRLHPGQAARDGILAADLALRGMTGPDRVFEGKNGFFQAFAGGEFSTEHLLQNLASSFSIMEVYFKPYPCCRHLHAVVDAIQEIKRLYPIQADQVAKIKIGVYQTAAAHHHKQCKNLLDAQMSLPYAAAAALLFDRIHVHVFQPQYAPERLWEICRATEIYVDEEADRIYPRKRSARVELEMVDGKRFRHFVDNPLGEPAKPMGDEQLAAKFIDNCTPILGEQEVKKILQDVKHMDKNIDFLF